MDMFISPDRRRCSTQAGAAMQSILDIEQSLYASLKNRLDVSTGALTCPTDFVALIQSDLARLHREIRNLLTITPPPSPETHNA
jgi:hypothetical protein